MKLFSADISPEELFNMFFGGGFPSCEYMSGVQYYKYVLHIH